MDKSKTVSRLKAPTKFQTPLRDITSDNKVAKTNVMQTAAAIRKNRKSKSFHVNASRMTGKTPTKPKTTTSRLNLTKRKSQIRPVIGTSRAPNITTRPLAMTSRTQAKKVTTTVTGMKRPAAESTIKSIATTSKSAPPAAKVSKFDYKTRFTIVEEKYKALLVQHKDLKASHEDLLKEFSSSSSTLESYTEQNHKLEEELKATMQSNLEYKVSQSSLNEKVNELDDLLAACVEEKHILVKEIHDLRNENHKLKFECGHMQAVNMEHGETIARLNEELHKAKTEIVEYKKELRAADVLRKELHNQVQDLKGNIRVYCRIRPMKQIELDEKMPCDINCLDESRVELKKSKESFSASRIKSGSGRLEFCFDKVYGEMSTQAEVFEDIAQLVQSTLDGYNVCVFAYGQTGSGKTYTMLGENENLGMIPRSMDLLYRRLKNLEMHGWTHEVQVDFLEIYNESIRDLLDPLSKQPHEILHNEGRGSIVTNINTQTVGSAGMMKKLMMQAHRNRAVAATDFNLHSSRSHAVTKISVTGYFEGNEYRGNLVLVDLAGSESAKNSERMNETKSINKSLSTLGTVMLALHNKESHIPYRNSKLTYLLQSCLGGNSKTLMFVNISPLEDCYNETVNSLRFAAKVKEVKTGSKRNKIS